MRGPLLVFSKARPDGYALGVFSTLEKAQAYIADWDPTKDWEPCTK
jgi:hypothetical protein